MNATDKTAGMSQRTLGLNVTMATAPAAGDPARGAGVDSAASASKSPAISGEFQADKDGVDNL
jgi:hypothetical protein